VSINPCGIPLLDVGRDVQGRFTKANPGGPGNPFARKVAALRKALLDSVSEQDLKDMVEVLKQQARQGDKAAIKLILQYCVGKPAPANDPDRMDADEWQRLQEMRVSPEQFSQTIESVPASLACDMAQSYWPCTVQDGPLAETVHYIHSQMLAAGQGATSPGEPGTNAGPNGARPDAAPAGERPSSAKGQDQSKDRRDSAGPSRIDSHSPTRSPSPNGGNEERRRQATEQRRPLSQPPRPSGQAGRVPPRG
jgi:hypothetical protein